MVSTGSISVSGLLGGMAGQIDTTALVSQLMQAQAIPQSQLKDQLTTNNSTLTAYQAINTKTAALLTAAQALTDPTKWSATVATSSSSTVVATSDGTASAGSTTFDVTQLAQAQTTTIASDSSGNVVSDPTAGITITGADGTPHAIALTSGSAADVAAAINLKAIGVRASVVTTDQGTILQLTAAKSGLANGFSVSGSSAPPANLITAQDAKVSVGILGSGGYTVSSASNSFTGFIPGVTFSATALATGVTVSLTSDEQSISDRVKALVSAANNVTSEVSIDSAKGGPLQGKTDVRTTAQAIMSAVSQGTAAGGSLSKYGIDMDKNGVMTFDADAFAAAYAADPAGTQTALSGSFATKLSATASQAVAPVTGTVTQAIAATTSKATRLNDEIDTWTTRLGKIQTAMQAKYAAMETALASLQSTQSYLTSMLDSATGSKSSSSSS